ncbi:MAG TPA: FAD-binding oxidoreductase [Candidatus Binatia bacterium]|nr:FAD-binding oxidoreductase [Candidatus Binatia bacterium]
MNSSLDRLGQKLASLLGADSVRCGPDSVTDSGSQLACAPETVEEVAAALRICAEAKAAITPLGGGTGRNVGNVVADACVAIDLRRLKRVVEHDHANLTATAQTGITVSDLNVTLAAQHQFLPFDPPQPRRATLGGTIALNMNGPRRGFYGAIRDLVIGMKVVLATGERIKAGGKVVKNVAGYDLCKLFTGSLGTLGIITEATVRVAPRPEAAATIVVSGIFAPVMEFVDQLFQSQLLPSAVVLMNSNFQKPGGNWQVAAWCEGLSEHVTRHLRDCEIIAQPLGLDTEILRDHTHSTLWDAVCDLPLESESCVYRVTLPRSAVAAYLAELRGIGEPPQVISDLTAGTLWLSWPANDDLARVFPELIALAHEQRGHVVLFAAPSGLKEGVDVWGPPPASHSLMRKIKQQFDPDRLLNPGRYIGRI